MYVLYVGTLLCAHNYLHEYRLLAFIKVEHDMCDPSTHNTKIHIFNVCGHINVEIYYLQLKKCD